MGAVDGSSEFGFEHRNIHFAQINSAPGQATLSSMSASGEASNSKANSCSALDVSEPFLVGEWDPLMSAAQCVDFSLPPFSAGLTENQGVHCSNVGLVQQIPTAPFFAISGYQEAVGSSAFADGGHASDAGRENSPPNNHPGLRKDWKGLKRKNMPGCSVFGSHSPQEEIQAADSEQLKDAPEVVKGQTAKKEEKRQRSEHTPDANTRKPNSKQAKDQSQNGNDGKEDYIHVRAKRGQATNSHSLAERVRREKISERMRFLQNLVPGCNKITGKAVMLDEIINYVQSLQRQVEFLSMKLAAVNPELNFDIEQLLSKDILNLRAGSSDALAFGLGLSSSLPNPNGFGVPQPGMQQEILFHSISNSQEMLKNTLPLISAIPQNSNLWSDELQNALQMGFLPHMPPGSSSTEPPGQ